MTASISGKIRIESLRSQIAIVTQEPILFNDTVCNNIAYGKPDASDGGHLKAAARAAYAYDFIDSFPEGFDTPIGELGGRLSGGEKQRICIARALLKDAPILILDEATSSLDTEAEMLVQKALENLMKGRTTFVIAHRLSTIGLCRPNCGHRQRPDRGTGPSPGTNIPRWGILQALPDAV